MKIISVLYNRTIRPMLLKILGSNIFIEERSLIRKYYKYSKEQHGLRSLAIFSLDGKDYTNGFADRLRGMITVYAYAKATGTPFRIEHKIPFQLQDYLQPNVVNWIFKENEKTYNLKYANPIVMFDHTKGSRFRWLPKNRQYHFYCNINAITLINKYYHTSFTYSQLFHELFKPSQALLDSIAPFDKYRKASYISISFRFMQLMGDLKDEWGKTLNQSEQSKYIKNCLSFIETIHNKNLNVTYVLVTSDSKTFMNHVKTLPYVFTLPGEIGHIGHSCSDAINMKMFLDFYMISQAKKAYMGYTGEMYKSNFAKSAAATTGIPYEAIHF